MKYFCYVSDRVEHVIMNFTKGNGTVKPSGNQIQYYCMMILLKSYNYIKHLPQFFLTMIHMEKHKLINRNGKLYLIMHRNWILKQNQPLLKLLLG